MRKNQTTTNTVDTGDYRSPDDIVQALREFIKGPHLIGNLMGCPVYVDASLPPGIIEIRQSDGRTLRVSVDHPYIRGTKLEVRRRR